MQSSAIRALFPLPPSNRPAVFRGAMILRSLAAIPRPLHGKQLWFDATDRASNKYP